MLKKILQAIIFISTIGLVKIRIDRKDGSKFSFDLLSTGEKHSDLVVYHAPDDDDDPTNDTYFVVEDGTLSEDLPVGSTAIGKLIYVSETMGYTPDAQLRKSLFIHVTTPA